MRELLTQTCEGLGIAAADLSFEESQGEGEQTLTVSLPYSAVQALDGREHRTARALRVVLSAAAAAKGTKLNVVVKAKD
jgi:predicted RNA-binding protein YlqC (UPF0109 family)